MSPETPVVQSSRRPCARRHPAGPSAREEDIMSTKLPPIGELDAQGIARLTRRAVSVDKTIGADEAREM
jgi:hypothetical protein